MACVSKGSVGVGLQGSKKGMGQATTHRLWDFGSFALEVRLLASIAFGRYVNY